MAFLSPKTGFYDTETLTGPDGAGGTGGAGVAAGGCPTSDGADDPKLLSLTTPEVSSMEIEIRIAPIKIEVEVDNPLASITNLV